MQLWRRFSPENPDISCRIFEKNCAVKIFLEKNSFRKRFHRARRMQFRQASQKTFIKSLKLFCSKSEFSIGMQFKFISNLRSDSSKEFWQPWRRLFPKKTTSFPIWVQNWSDNIFFSTEWLKNMCLSQNTYFWDTEWQLGKRGESFAKKSNVSWSKFKIK